MLLNAACTFNIFLGKFMTPRKYKMSEQSIQHKQQYLRQKILEAGHDAQAFMSFCQSNYGQIDLEGWSYARLKQIVQDFLGQKAEVTFTQNELDNQQCYQDHQQESEVEKGTAAGSGVKSELVFTEADWSIFGLGPPHRKVQNQPPPRISRLDLNNQSLSLPSVLPSPYKKPLVSQPNQLKPTIDEPFYSYSTQSQPNNKPGADSSVFQVLQMQKQPDPTNGRAQTGSIEMRVIKSKQLPELPPFNDVKIIKTEQKSKNFLQGDYTLYHIQFAPINHVIQRKFNDFRKLRVILQKIYPHVRLPYLEPEGWLVNTSETKDEQTLNKYKHMIVEFLKYITMRNELIKKSKIVRIFIGMADGTQTDFKKYENIARPKLFSQLCVPGGVLHFAKYDQLNSTDKYLANAQVLSSNVDALYDKLRKAMDNLFYNYEQVGKSLTEVAGIFQSLEDTVHKFNSENQDRHNTRIYEGLKEVCLKTKGTLDGHYDIFRNQVQALFRYEKQNMTTVKQINQIRHRMFYEYARQGLTAKKAADYLPKESALIDANLAIDQPCKNNKNLLTVQNMFWSYFALRSVQDYWQQLRHKINEQLTLIAYDELDSENRNLNFWNTMIKKCVID